jgi:hypothetical protein
MCAADHPEENPIPKEETERLLILIFDDAFTSQDVHIYNISPTRHVCMKEIYRRLKYYHTTSSRGFRIVRRK